MARAAIDAAFGEITDESWHDHPLVPDCFRDPACRPEISEEEERWRLWRQEARLRREEERKRLRREEERKLLRWEEEWSLRNSMRIWKKEERRLKRLKKCQLLQEAVKAYLKEEKARGRLRWTDPGWRTFRRPTDPSPTDGPWWRWRFSPEEARNFLRRVSPGSCLLEEARSVEPFPDWCRGTSQLH